MKIVKGAQALTEKMQDGVVTAPAPEGGVQGGARAVQFQKKFDARSPEDDTMNMKLQMMDQNGMTPFGQVYYDDKAARWVERKAAVAEAVNFDSYFNVNFNKNDLASRQWAQQINPEFYRSREREMAEKAEVILKLKGIQLRGPQSNEDLYTQFLIETGRAKLPPDWDRLGPGYSGDEEHFLSDANIALQENRLRQGLIRMPVFLTQGQRASQASGNNAVGAWGSSASARNPFGDQTGQAVNGARNQPLSRQKPGDGNTVGFDFQKFLGQAQ